jgi:hypothetical protein
MEESLAPIRDKDEAKGLESNLVIEEYHPGFVEVFYEVTTDDSPFLSKESRATRPSGRQP